MNSVLKHLCSGKGGFLALSSTTLNVTTGILWSWFEKKKIHLPLIKHRVLDSIQEVFIRHFRKHIFYQ